MNKIFIALAAMIMITGCSVLGTLAEDFKAEFTAPIDPITGEVMVEEGATNFDAILQTAFGVGKMFFPALAVWEGGLAMVSRRKRRHYVDAVKAIIPSDGKVSLKDAALSMMRATGGAHSSTDTKEVFEKK